MNSRLEFLTAEEMADRLRLRPDTVRSWARRGLIPSVRLSSKVVRFEPGAVIEAMTKRQANRDRRRLQLTNA